MRREYDSTMSDAPMKRVRGGPPARCTHTQVVRCGSKAFVQGLERATGRILEPQSGGRPRSVPQASGQGKLGFQRSALP